MKNGLVDDATTEGLEFATFLASLRSLHDDLKPVFQSEVEQYLQTVPLLPTQFMYVHDIRSGRFFHKGFDRCLGYDLSELTADFIVRFIHPADRSMYFTMSKALLSFVLGNAPGLAPFATTFQMNYRVQKADGTYIAILRQSTPFIINQQHEVVAHLSICTDISLIATSSRINWHLAGPLSDMFPPFLQDYLQRTQPLFSEREQDILRLVGQGLSSQEIGDRLFISINTVNTHRKSLMKKANVNKTVDLIAHARELGYI